MRGDSYQLQGQGGGVVINDGQSTNGYNIRSIIVLVSGSVTVDSLNIVDDSSNTPIAVGLGVLDAGTVLNGVFTQVIIEGASSKAICYYE
jgi:hypothetical protein